MKSPDEIKKGLEWDEVDEALRKISFDDDGESDMRKPKTSADIKKGLHHCSKEGCGGCPYEEDCFETDEPFSDLAKDSFALIQQLEAQAPRWISVEERLPERGITKCSACVKCGDGLKRVVCASYNAELKLWTGWHGEKIGNVITHWMPLPEPPKEPEA